MRPFHRITIFAPVCVPRSDDATRLIRSLTSANFVVIQVVVSLTLNTIPVFEVDVFERVAAIAAIAAIAITDSAIVLDISVYTQ